MHADGDWHGAIHVWVVTTAYRLPELVLQRRSRTKDTWGGRLDVSVGGHIRAGETVEDTVREADEELGLALAPHELVPLGRRFAHGTTDNEVQIAFGAVVTIPLTALRLHPEEVDAVVRLSLPVARALLVEGRRVRVVERCRDEPGEREREVGPEDVVPPRDAYYAAALDALGVLLAGDPVIPFELR